MVDEQYQVMRNMVAIHTELQDKDNNEWNT
jgi:hypothetical protein